MQTSCEHLDLVFLQCLLLFCSSVSSASITIRTLQDVQLGENMTVCCLAQQWSGFEPALRLMISTIVDEKTKTPTQTSSGDYQLCFESVVSVDYHLSTAECVAIYGEEWGRRDGTEKFSVTLVLRVFALHFKMKVKTVSSSVKKSRVYSCLCSVTYQDPDEVTITWYINGQSGYGDYPETHSTQSLGDLRGKTKKTLPLYSVTSSVTIGMEVQQSDVYCHCRHAYQGLLTNTTILPSSPQEKHGISITTDPFIPVTSGTSPSSVTVSLAVSASIVLIFLLFASALYFANRRQQGGRERSISTPPPSRTISIDLNSMLSRSSRYDFSHPGYRGSF